MIVINRFNFKKYDVAKVAAALRGKGIEDTDAYKQATDELIDMTMSCDHEECTSALVNTARGILAMASGKVDALARARFLAAYDLAVHVDCLAFA